MGIVYVGLLQFNHFEKTEKFMTEFQPFEMERMMSKYEQAVEYNLSESGVRLKIFSWLFIHSCKIGNPLRI